MESLVIILVTVLLIGFGFWLGRKTLVLPIDGVKIHDPGKTPIFEEDPYRTAMTGEEDVIEDVH